jgi:hypothetical protein
MLTQTGTAAFCAELVTYFGINLVLDEQVQSRREQQACKWFLPGLTISFFSK